MSSSDESPDPSPSELDLGSLDTSEYRSKSGSFRSSALPHQHVPDGLEWEITACETDTGESPNVEISTQTLSLLGVEWETITIEARVAIEDWLYDFVSPPPEDRDEEWSARLGLVSWCRQTICRERSDPEAIAGPGEYHITYELSRADIYQTTHIEPKLVCTGYGDETSAHASAAGHRLAEGDTWTLRTDLERTTKNLLHPETKSFEDDDDLPGEDHLLFVDFDRDPPGVYINGDHERIVAALDSDSNQGWDASVREVAYDTIEAEVWPQMILEAAADVTEDGGPETAWKQGVIEKFREELYGEGTSYDDAVDFLYEDVNSPERLGRLMQDIDDAIQVRNDAPSHLNKLLRLVDNR